MTYRWCAYIKRHLSRSCCSSLIFGDPQYEPPADRSSQFHIIADHEFLRQIGRDLAIRQSLNCDLNTSVRVRRRGNRVGPNCRVSVWSGQTNVNVLTSDVTRPVANCKCDRPRCRCFIAQRSNQTEPIQLVAGGSGIVPLMAMLRSRASAGSIAPFRLLYSVREPGAVFYRDELRELSSQGDSVIITYAYTRVTPRDWPRPAGRINAGLIASDTLSPTIRPISYVCGPTSFVEYTTDLLIANGYDREKIKTERFGATGERK